MLTPVLLRELRSDAGAELMERARELIDDPFAAEKLRRLAPPDLAAAAVEQARLRKRAASRFSRADRMWFAPGLLEQASGDTVSRYRMRRFAPQAGEPAGDFCCGLGGDAVAMAEYRRVVAVDRDPLALALARANAEALGCAERLETREGEIPRDAPAVPQAWVDPGRRETGARTRRLDAISPTLAEVLSLRARTPGLGVKLSPATADPDLDRELAGVPVEKEWISVGGECRELVLWLGTLIHPGGESARRATVLPAEATLAGHPRPYGEVRPPGALLLEPDAAVIRAGLVGNLAERLGAWPIDPRLAYLSTDEPLETEFATAYRVRPPEPFSEKTLVSRLRELQAGDVVLKTRGSAVQPESLRHRLRGVLKQGRRQTIPVVFITRLGGRPAMMMGERFGPRPE